MQISYELLYFHLSNRPQHSFKRLHQGLKNVRRAYESHISRPQPHGFKTAPNTAWTLSSSKTLKGSEGGSKDSRGGPGGVQRVSRNVQTGSRKGSEGGSKRVPGTNVFKDEGPCVQPTTQMQPAFCAGGSSRPNGSRYPLGGRHQQPRILQGGWEGEGGG